jgi:putative ABC transport system permease protein
VFTARVLLDETRYPEAPRRRQLVADLMTRLRSAPGVRSAGVVSFLPLCGWSSGTAFRTPARPDEERESGILAAEPGYFTTMRIPLLRGRHFAAGDDDKAPRVAIVDERFVRYAFGGGAAAVDPIGQRVNFGTAGAPEWHEIIGVVGDVENDPPPDPQRPMVYVPFAQGDWPFYGLVVRTDGDPTAIAATVRDSVWSIDRDQPVSYAMPMQSLVADAFAVDRTITWILSFFAALAVVLAAMGIYGVLAHHVLERRHEIGIRMALGASRSHVLGLVLRRLLVMTAAGIVVGLGCTLIGGRVLAAMLYGISPRDPALLGGVVVLLAAVAGLAAWLPLRRALRTEPMVALRDD